MASQIIRLDAFRRIASGSGAHMGSGSIPAKRRRNVAAQQSSSHHLAHVVEIPTAANAARRTGVAVARCQETLPASFSSIVADVVKGQVSGSILITCSDADGLEGSFSQHGVYQSNPLAAAKALECLAKRFRKLAEEERDRRTGEQHSPTGGRGVSL